MFDCAIIGAGLAGLVAARHLVDRGLKVVVLEGRDRVGGRVENKTLNDGSYVELGGQWIGSGYDSLQEIIDELGFKTIGLPSSGKLVVRLRGKSIEVPSSEEMPALTPFEVADLGQGLLRLRRLSQRLRDDPAWRKSNVVWLNQDLRRWVASNLRTQGAQRRFGEVYAAAFGAMPKDATLIDGLLQVTSGIDLETMLASNGGLHQQRVEGGVAAVAQAMGEQLGDVIRLEAEVVKVEHDENSARLTLADGEVVEARQIISTLPPQLAVSLEHNPPLPEWRQEAADKVAPGNVIKAFLVYQTPFWRKKGFSGQSSADEGAVRVTFDTTAEGNERGHLMGFFEGAGASSLAQRSVTLRERAFVDAVARAFGDEGLHPIGYVERDWATERFTGGCHGAHFSPGVWTTNGPLLAQSEGVLHWAGAEYATRFNGYLEGAVRSGREAATVVARALA